jgi:hypothetical protein
MLQEVVEFLVGLPDPGPRQIMDRSDRPHPLAPRLLLQR